MKAGIITLTGDLGSGKSSVGRLLAQHLNGYELYCTGQAFRKLAAEMGLSVNELSLLAETDEAIDRALDNELILLGRSGKKVIVDARLGWHFIPHSYKVYLCVSYETAARRIMNADRGDVERYAHLEMAAQCLKERKCSERKRFLEKYGIDILDMKNYDIVIDTGDITVEETMQRILEALDRACPNIP